MANPWEEFQDDEADSATGTLTPEAIGPWSDFAEPEEEEAKPWEAFKEPDPIGDYNSAAAIAERLARSRDENYAKYNELSQVPERTPEIIQQMVSAFNAGKEAETGLYGEQERLNTLRPEVERIQAQRAEERRNQIESKRLDPAFGDSVADQLYQFDNQMASEMEEARSIADIEERNVAFENISRKYADQENNLIKSSAENYSKAFDAARETAWLLRQLEVNNKKAWADYGASVAEGFGDIPFDMPDRPEGLKVADEAWQGVKDTQSKNRAETEEAINKLISGFPADRQEQIRRDAEEWISVQKGEKEVAIVQGRPVFSKDVQGDYDRAKQLTEDLFTEGEINEVQRNATIEALDATAVAEREDKLNFIRSLPDYQQRAEGKTDDEVLESYEKERGSFVSSVMDYFSGATEGFAGYIDMATDGQRLRSALESGDEDQSRELAFDLIQKAIDSQKQKADPFRSETATQAGQVMGQVGAQILSQKGGELGVRGLSLAVSALLRSPTINQLGQQAAPWVAGAANAVANANIYGLDWFQSTVNDFLDTANVQSIDQLSEDQKKQLFKEATDAFYASQLPSVTELIEPTMFLQMPKAARKTIVGRAADSVLNIGVEVGQEKFTEEWKNAYMRNAVSAHQAQSTMGMDDMRAMALGLLPLGGAKFAVDTVRARRQVATERRLQDLEKADAARAEQLRAEQAAIAAAEEAANNAATVTPESADAMKQAVEAAKTDVETKITEGLREGLVRLPEDFIAQRNQTVNQALERIRANDVSQILQDVTNIAVDEVVRPAEGLNPVTVRGLKDDVTYLENLINKNEFKVSEIDKTRFKTFMAPENYERLLQVVESNPKEAIASLRGLVDDYVSRGEVPVEGAGGGEEEEARILPAVRTIADSIRDKDTFVYEGMRGALNEEDGEVVFRPFGTQEKYTVAVNPNQTLDQVEGIQWARHGQRRIRPEEERVETATIIEQAPTITTEEADTTEDSVQFPQALVEIERSPTLNFFADLFDTGESKVSQEGKRARKVSETPEFYRQVQPEQIEQANRLVDSALRIIDAMPIAEDQKAELSEPFLLLDQDISTYESNPEYQRYKSSIVREVRPAVEAGAVPETEAEVAAGVTELEQRAAAEVARLEQEAQARRVAAGQAAFVAARPTEVIARVARAEATPQEFESLVEQGLAEEYKGQQVLTQAGIDALPENERPRLTPEARRIQIDTGSSEVVAEAISKGLRFGVDQVPPTFRMPEGWTLDGDIYIPPPRVGKPYDVETLAKTDEDSEAFNRLIERKYETEAEVMQKPAGSAFATPDEFRAAFDLRGQGHARFAIRLDLMVADNALTPESRDLILATIWENKTSDEFLLNMEMGSSRPNVKRSYGRGGITRQTVETQAGPATGYKPFLQMLRDARLKDGIDERTAEILGTFWHEFGHAGYYSLLDQNQKNIVNSIYKQTSRAQKIKFFSEGAAAAGQVNFYSKYYSGSEAEWFAQTFSEYVLTEKSEHKKLVPVFDSILNKIKKVFNKLFARQGTTAQLNDIFEYILQGKDYAGKQIWWQGATMSTNPPIYGTRGAQGIDPTFSKRLLAEEKRRGIKITTPLDRIRLEKARVIASTQLSWSPAKSPFGTDVIEATYNFTDPNLPIDQITIQIEEFSTPKGKTYSTEYRSYKNGKYLNIWLRPLITSKKSLKEAKNASLESIADVITGNTFQAGAPPTAPTGIAPEVEPIGEVPAPQDPDTNEDATPEEVTQTVTNRSEAKKAQELVAGHSILADEIPTELNEETQARYENGMALGDFLNPEFFNLGEAYKSYISAIWLNLNGGLMPTVKVEGKEIAKPEKGTTEAEALRLLKRASDILDARSETVTGGKDLTYSLQDIMATWMDSGLGQAALKNAIVQYTNLDVAQADKTAADFARVYELAQDVTAAKERAQVRMDRALPAVTNRQQREKERMIKLEEAAGTIDSIAEAIRVAFDVNIKKPKTDRATEKKQIEEQLRVAKRIIREVVPRQYLGDQLLTLERATGLEGLKKVVEAAQNGLNEARLDGAVSSARKAYDRAQKAVKANEISPEAMAVLRDFVETYSKKGIGPETRAKIEEAMKRYEADPVGALEDLAVQKYLKQKGALQTIKIDKSLGLDALREITAMVNSTLHADKVARGEMLFNKQQTRMELVDEIAEELESKKSIVKQRKDGGMGIGLFNKIALYKGARVESILRGFGLEKLRKFVYESLAVDAYNDDLGTRRDLKKKIEARVKDITGLEIGTRDYDLWSKEMIELTGVDSSGFSKPIKVQRREFLDMVASLRDESNFRRAVNSGGYVIDRLDTAAVDTVKITPDTYFEILNKMTDQDTQMVDMMIGMYNDDLLAILENASLQAYGHGIKGVTGTYYPRTADKWTRTTETKKDMDYIAYYQRRVDDVGYLKERDEKAKSKLRAVDFLQRLDYHVTNDARIGAYLPIVRDIEMVLNDPKIARPLAQKIGTEGLEQIKEMVRQQTTPPAGLPMGLMSTLVGNAGVGVLGFKLHAAMQNPVGIPIALAYYGKDGFKYLAKAFPFGFQALKPKDRKEMAAVLSKYSPYYNERYGDGGFIQEFTSGLSNAPSDTKWRKNLETAAMSWLEGTDRWGALVRYKIAQQVVRDRTTLQEGTEEFNRAVAREWNLMMFRSENTAHGADRTGAFQFAGRHPVFKVFIMFQSAVSKQYSLFVEAMLQAQQGGRQNLQDAATKLAFLSISLAASRAISQAFYSVLFPPEDEEEKEKTWAQLLGKVAGTPLSIVPVVGPTLQNFTESFFSPDQMRKPMQIDLISSFIFGIGDTLMLTRKAIDQLTDEQIDEATGNAKFWETSYRAIKKALAVGGIPTGVPAAGVVQTGELGFKLFENLRDVFNDEPKTEDFQKKVREYEGSLKTEPVRQEMAKLYFAVTENDQKAFNRAYKDILAKRPDIKRSDLINSIRRRQDFRVVGMVRSGKLKQKDLEANGISRDYFLEQKALLRSVEKAAATMWRDAKDSQ